METHVSVHSIETVVFWAIRIPWILKNTQIWNGINLDCQLLSKNYISWAENKVKEQNFFPSILTQLLIIDIIFRQCLLGKCHSLLALKRQARGPNTFKK